MEGECLDAFRSMPLQLQGRAGLRKCGSNESDPVHSCIEKEEKNRDIRPPSRGPERVWNLRAFVIRLRSGLYQMPPFPVSFVQCKAMPCDPLV